MRISSRSREEPATHPTQWFFWGKDVNPTIEKVEVALRDLRPEIDTVTDLSDFIPGAPGATAALSRGGELLIKRGRRHGVRVTGGLMTCLMQFKRQLKGVVDEKTTRYEKSIEEADAILDSWTDEP
jgi:hypothetical protein